MIQKTPNFDSTLDVLRDGYLFIAKKRAALKTDRFQTRLLLKKAIIVSSKEAAELFYDNDFFMRNGAMPLHVQNTLTGKKGVQTLDGAEHHHRKAMFMNFMTPQSIGALMKIMRAEWERYAAKWQKMDAIILFPETQEILCRASLQWAGVPFKDTEIRALAGDYGLMIDGFGGVFKRYWRGRFARKRGEKWMINIIQQVRDGKIIAKPQSPLHGIAFHTQPDGEILNARVAAVEMMSLIRPIVAIATYFTFAAKAMQDYSEMTKKLRNDEGFTELFVQEVRRFYPFTPFLGARARKDFDWNNIHFSKGVLTILDVYGINHDTRYWDHPETFQPDRFKNWRENPFDFIPQGGGDFGTGHRCAGEWVTIETMKLGIDFLVRNLSYDVPQQDMGYSLIRMPTLPRSGFIMTKIKNHIQSDELSTAFAKAS